MIPPQVNYSSQSFRKSVLSMLLLHSIIIALQLILVPWIIKVKNNILQWWRDLNSFQNDTIYGHVL